MVAHMPPPWLKRTPPPPQRGRAWRHGSGGRAWRHGSGGVMTDTQMIKRCIAFRAKYRLDQGPGPSFRVLSPNLVVPHPRNRGGDLVKSLRTKELSGEVLEHGCDPTEACSNALAVQEQLVDAEVLMYQRTHVI